MNNPVFRRQSHNAAYYIARPQKTPRHPPAPLRHSRPPSFPPPLSFPRKRESPFAEYHQFRRRLCYNIAMRQKPQLTKLRIFQ
ncbi:MAG: hypothetical protein ACR2P4_09800 [Gammaproteobacteria bacterium]